MSSMENEPLEVRKAYAISELYKIVMAASSVEAAKADCKIKLQELVRDGIVRNFHQDVLEIKEIIMEKISDKFNPIFMAEKLLEEANELRNEKKYELAIEMYREAVLLNPKEYKCYLGLASVYYLLGQYEEALFYQSFFSISYIDSDSLDTYYHDLAKTYWKLGEHEKTVEHYLNSIDLNPTADLYAELADVLMRIEHYDEAATYYQLAINLNSDKSTYYNELGVVYYNVGKFAEALGAFEQATRLEPKISVYYANQGLVYFALKKFEQAVKSYQIAINLEPGNAEHYKDQGRAYYHLEEYAEAMSAFRRCTELDPHIPDYYEFLLDASTMAGKGRETARQIEALIKSMELDDEAKTALEDYILMGKTMGLAPGWFIRWAAHQWDKRSQE